MRKILGLDLGTNSIGWALINSEDSIDSIGTRIFPNKKMSKNFERTQQRSLKLDIKYILCVLLTVLMFSFAYFMKSNWQFWLNLGIGGVFILLNMKYKNGKND